MATNKKTLLAYSFRTPLMLALEKILREIEDLDVDVIKNFFNPDKCRVDLLPFLAEFLGVDMWDDSLSEEQKRQICKDELYIQMHKGTTSAVKRALKTLDITADIVEWWTTNDMKPMTAKLTLQQGSVIYSEKQFSKITNLIHKVKRLALQLAFSKELPPYNNIIYVGSAVKFTRKTIINVYEK